MEPRDILDAISRGRTDLIFRLLDRPEWRELLGEGRIKPLQWLVYYNDLTGLEAVMREGGGLESLSLDRELGNAAFFGHWKICDFLLRHGADVHFADPESGETALHSALAKAGRPYYLYVLRVLLEHGARVDARTNPGRETGAFMRDVRTRGETPLHRAAAYGDEEMIRLLLDHGAEREARDAQGDSPLTWASRHLRPGRILDLLAFGPHRIGAASRRRIVSDHGAGWGNGMEWNLLGDYLPGDLEE